MIKKLIITGAAAGLLLVSAASAFATNNTATDIKNSVTTSVNTGYNTVNGSSHSHHSSSGMIGTGNASAQGVGVNVVNTNVGTTGGHHSSSVSNSAHDVSNTVTTSANTGNNTVNGGGSIGTGDAGASGLGLNVVNTNVSGL